MKNFFLIFTLIIFALGCDKIVLKKTSAIQIPFKIEKGDYSLNIYRLNYPLKIEEKQQFWNENDVFLRKLVYKDGQVSLLLNEEFFEDIKRIEEGKLLKEEEILRKTASSLSKEEILEIIEKSGFRIEKYHNTVQEYLNLQVSQLIEIINSSLLKTEDINFEKNKVYTELEKEELINILKDKRNEMIKVMKKAKVYLIVYIDVPYKEEKQNNEGKYYYTKEIKLDNDKSAYYLEKVKQYQYPVYIENLSEEDVKKIYEREKELKNKCVILYNKKYVGYKVFNGDFVFFAGGEEKKEMFYEGYNITIQKENITFTELLKKEDKVILNDFIGGKK